MPIALQLPSDIWLHIARFVPPNQIRVMLGVNQVFFYLAMDERYRSLSIASLDTNLMRLLIRLEDPFVAKRVRTVNILTNLSNQLVLHSQSQTLEDVKLHRQAWSSKFKSRLNFFRSKCRRNSDNHISPLVSETDTVSGPDLLQTLERVIGSLSNVTHVALRRTDYNFIDPLLSIGWRTYGSNLRRLSLSIPLEEYATFESPITFSSLEDLDISLSRVVPWSLPRDDTAVSKDLAPFVNGLKSTMQSFSLSLNSCVNLSSLFQHLEHFPRLRQIFLAIVIDSAHLSEPSHLERFFSRHNETLQRITLHTSPCVLESYSGVWNPTSLCPIVFPKLQELELEIRKSTEMSMVTLMSIAHSYKIFDTLTVLRLTNYNLTYTEVNTLASAFSHCRGQGRAPGDALRSLHIDINKLSPQLLDLLAEKLPHLRELSLVYTGVVEDECMDVSHEERSRDSSVELFKAEMRGRRYSDWDLSDITLLKLYRYPCSSEELHILAGVLADCLPGARRVTGIR